MKFIKVSGTGSEMTILFEEGAVKVAGELTLTPAFYADINSFDKWEHSGKKVTKEEKQEIIRLVLENNDPKFIVYFD
jgi:hypothetical protein